MNKKRSGGFYWLGWISWLLSALWTALCLSYALHQVGLRGFLDLAPQEIGEFLAGVVSLPVFLWMAVGHWQRLEAMKATTARLQEQLDALLNPATSKTANLLMASLKQQTDSLNTASHNAIDTLRGIRGLLHQEGEAFAQLTQKSATQFEGINTALGERTTALNSVAEKTETTSKLVLGSLATLETSANRVDQLSQAMESRATILGGLGNKITEQLDKGGATVEENLKQMAAMTSRFSEQQKDLTDTGKSMAADFRAASDQVAESASEIHVWLDQWASTGRQISVETKAFEETLKQRAEALDGTATSLGRVTEQAAVTVDRLNESGEKFAQTRLNFDAGLNSVGQRLDEAAGKLDGQIAIISSAEDRLGEHLHTVHSALGKARIEHEGLTQTIQTLSERTGGAIERLESLRAASSNGIEEIVFQSERLQRQSSALEVDLQKSAGTVAGVLSQMAHVGQTVEQASSQLDAQTHRAIDALAKTREGLEQVSRDIGLQGSIVAARSSDTVATLSEASGRITEIAAASMSQLQSVALGLERVNNEVALNAEKAGQRATGAADTLKAGAAELQAVANQVDNAALDARQAVDALVVNGGLLRSTVGDAAGLAKGAAADLGEAITAITGSAQQGRQELGSLAEQLRIENDMIFRTINRVAEIDGALRNSGAFVNDIAERARQTIIEVQGGVEKVGQEINVQTVTAAEKFSVTNEILNRTRDELDRVVSKVDSTFGTLNRKAGEINFVVSTSVNRLGEMSKSIEHAKATIEDSTNAVAAKLTDAAATLRTEFADVQAAASGAVESMSRTLTRIEAGTERASLSNQQAEAQLNETLRLVERRGETFATAITLATANLDHADRAFADKQREISLLIEETGGRFDRLSSDMARQSAMLGDTAVAAAEKLMGASAEIEGRVTSIGDTVEDAKILLQRFSADAGEIADNTLAAAQNVATQEQTLREAIVRLGAIADDVEADLTKSAEALSISAVDLSSAAGHAKGEIIGATDELKEQSRAMLSVEAESRMLMEKVAEMIGEKATALAISVRDTASHTAGLRDADAKARRDLFLNSAKSVLDGLSSLSVDLTRVLDQDIPEKVWKGLARGDIASFPKRLAAARDQIPVSEVRMKFVGDGAFRLATQNYLTQFEQLLEQAMDIDQGDILSSTLMSSDVGKIYYFLSSAVGRERGLQKAV